MYIQRDLKIDTFVGPDFELCFFVRCMRVRVVKIKFWWKIMLTMTFALHLRKQVRWSAGAEEQSVPEAKFFLGGSYIFTFICIMLKFKMYFKNGIWEHVLSITEGSLLQLRFWRRSRDTRGLDLVSFSFIEQNKNSRVYFVGPSREIPVISYLWQFIVTLSRAIWITVSHFASYKFLLRFVPFRFAMYSKPVW